MDNFSRAILVNLVFACILSTCTSSQQQVTIDQDLKRAADSNTDFGLRLYRQLASSTTNDVFISPLGLSTAFGMLAYGLNGATAKELQDVVGYVTAGLGDKTLQSTFERHVKLRTNASSGYTLTFASAILVERNLDLNPEYRFAVRANFGSPVAPVDFQRNSNKIIDAINRWVRNKTKGKIRSLVDDLDPGTVLMILNAIYFKASWKTQFLPALTRPDFFYNKGVDAKSVPMMHNHHVYPYASGPGFEALELPYAGDHVSMVILLPKERTGLSDLEDSLTVKMLQEIRQNLQPTEMDVIIPKFKLEFEENLVDALKAMGLRKIFRAGSDDFSGISQRYSRDIFVKDVIHKSVIETNEEGSEAAAVTAIRIVVRTRPTYLQFKANHPFIFLITDNKSNTLLFMGRVMSL